MLLFTPWISLLGQLKRSQPIQELTFFMLFGKGVIVTRNVQIQDSSGSTICDWKETGSPMHSLETC
uniref:Macaca fascicularis brain cDNA clone: QflA-19261, similar to human TU12B1-TY protein (TU12B1-TY), mRNA, RefSeq: NM_016575.1 n=1 Tax=Macaca fascicularis TaxID=9541 RepID=I7G643_MACFA|nr:unnamed protein product [Macaca fascicularis]